MAQSKRSKTTDLFSKRALTWQRIRNNWTHVTFLFIYFFINVVLFVSRAYQYMESNIYVVVARACGKYQWLNAINLNLDMWLKLP